ncbi:MAG: OmpA family protein [Cyanobacteria bacterium P01_H01_bin.119]
MSDGRPSPPYPSGTPSPPPRGQNSAQNSAQGALRKQPSPRPDGAELPPFGSSTATVPQPGAGSVSARTRAATAKRSPQPGLLKTLWTTLFRLILLGLGSSAAWAVGVMVAQINPAQPQAEPPLQETVLRGTNRTLTKLRQLPQWWQQDGISPAPVAAVPQVQTAPSPSSPSPSQAQAPSQTAPELDGEARADLQAEVSDVQTELSALSDRVDSLEQELGQPNGGRTLERRLDIIEQQLSQQPSTAAAPEANSSVNSSGQSSGRTAEQTVPSLARLPQVTLPSDALFASNSSQLKPGADPILEAIVTDLLVYPGATIVLAAHTDSQSDAADNRELSYLRASALERYFREALGDQYRWVPVGYGETRPVTDTDSAQSDGRNRRIEITIDQRS